MGARMSERARMSDLDPTELLRGDADAVLAVLSGTSAAPHSLLGPHQVVIGSEPGVVVRAFHPDATSCTLLRGKEARPMKALGGGLFGAFLPEVEPSISY